jgi:hypothetical protein
MQSACTLVASLALAQAGPAQFSSAAKQFQDSQVRSELPSTLLPPSIHRMLTYGLTQAIDDGSAETALGLSGGGDFIALNEFEAYPTPDLPITSVSIAWGSPALPDPSLDGLSYTAVIWSDPNGDGNPDDAVVVAVGPGVISQAGTDTFVSTSFDLSPPLFFFVGFLIHHNAGQLPAAFDETPPTVSNRSFFAGGAHGNIYNLKDNDFPVAPIENSGSVGNWLIRAVQGGPTPSPTPAPLWYNGDFDGVDGLGNEQDTALGADQYAHTYDDFIVSDARGWDVTSVYSNNLSSTNIVGATWEIRQGISPGNGGTLIASGMTTTPFITATGRGGYGFTEFNVEVLGLNLHLPEDTNHYWLNVTPIGDLTGLSFVSTTSGENAIGQPLGNNQNAFFDSNFFGAVFESTADQGQPHDFSMGVKGTVTASQPLVLQSAFSRKTHGKAGDFDLPLPLTGAEGIESRSGRDSIYLTFNNNLTSVGSVTSSCGKAWVILNPDDPRNLVVTVSGSCNATNITITADSVRDDQGNMTSVTLTYGKLIGDVDASGVVDTLDGQAIWAAAPAPVDSSNFRDDLNHDGTVNARDHTIAKSDRGERLP